MKNKFWILILIIIIGLIFYFLFNNSTSDNTSENYTAQKTEIKINSTDNKSDKNVTETKNNTSVMQESVKEQPPIETEIATYTTKIMTKDSGRQKNISITCSTLNDKTVENGATFSFCDTVGPATSAKGYQKAEIFDANGNKKMGLGGGNCQISTTLYNAVLSVPSLTVTERHPHSNKVPYIQSGKDAAVAYGSYDLKFVNNSGKTIKIKAIPTDDDITIKLFELS